MGRIKTFQNGKLKKLLGFFLVLYVFALPLSISLIELTSFVLSYLCVHISFTYKGFFKAVDLRPLFWTLLPFLLWGIVTSLFYPSYTWSLKMDMIKDHANLTFLCFLPSVLWVFWLRFPAYSNYMIALLGIVSFYGLVQFFTGWAFDSKEQFSILQYGDHFYYRVRGFFNNTMTYNYVMAAFFYWLYFHCFSHLIAKLKNGSSIFGISGISWTDAFKYLCFCLLSLSLILTLTRSFLLVLPLVLLLSTFVFYGFRPFLVAFFSMVVAGACLYSTSLFQNRFSPAVKQDHSLSYRFHLWRVHWKMFLDSPLVGQGLSQKVSNKYLEPYYQEQGVKPLFSHAHNNILSVLAGMGIIGLLCYAFMMAYFFYLAFILYKRKGKVMSLWERDVLMALLAFMLTFHLGGMMESNFLDGEPLHVLLLGFSMLLVLRQHYLKQEKTIQV